MGAIERTGIETIAHMGTEQAAVQQQRDSSKTRYDSKEDNDSNARRDNRQDYRGRSPYRKSDRRSPTPYRHRVDAQYADGICGDRDCHECGTGPQEAGKDRNAMEEHRYCHSCQETHIVGQHSHLICWNCKAKGHIESN